MQPRMYGSSVEKGQGQDQSERVMQLVLKARSKRCVDQVTPAEARQSHARAYGTITKPRGLPLLLSIPRHMDLVAAAGSLSKRAIHTSDVCRGLWRAIPCTSKVGLVRGLDIASLSAAMSLALCLLSTLAKENTRVETRRWYGSRYFTVSLNGRVTSRETSSTTIFAGRFILKFLLRSLLTGNVLSPSSALIYTCTPPLTAPYPVRPLVFPPSP